MTQALVKPHPTDTCLTLTGVSWTEMEVLEAAFENIAGVRFAYLDGILDIMTISPEHEEIKRTIGLLLETYLREKGIRFYGRGGPTLGKKELGARKEPDESYNIHQKKANPDLVVEVVLTSGGVDKLELYKRLGVSEVWFWEDGVLAVYYLRQEEDLWQYERVERSVLLPALDLTVLGRYICHHDQYDGVTEFIQMLREG
ncbi:MAG: Uma2 family endonuclease [Oscillatoriaceae cyanobacterium]